MPRPPRDAWVELMDEVAECTKEPALDELSDIAFAIGRLIAGLVGRTYVGVPFDGRHKRKIEERMRQYGCVRSERHLVDGKCPSM